MRQSDVLARDVAAALRRYERERTRQGLRLHCGSRGWDEQHALDVEENPDADFELLERLYDAASARECVQGRLWDRAWSRTLTPTCVTRSSRRSGARRRGAGRPRVRRSRATRAGLGSDPDSDLDDHRSRPGRRP